MSRNPLFSWHSTCQKENIPSPTHTSSKLVPDINDPIEQETAEKQRQSQEDLLWYKNLYENLPSLYFTLDKTSRILSVNQFGADSLGYNREELIGELIFKLFAKVEQKKLADGLGGLLLPGRENQVEHWELRLNCPSSKILWVKIAARALPSGGGNPAILMVCEDVTAHKQAEDALRESEERFHIMADTAPVMLWMAGCDGRSTFFNHYWLEFTGRTLEQELGLGWLEGVHPDDKNYCLENYYSAFSTRRKLKMEYRLRRTDGLYCWILNTGVPRFTPNGNFAGYIGSCIDITERKETEVALVESERKAQAQLQEMEILNRLKDEFLSTVSHELRTPLTNMKMAIQMLGIALNREKGVLSQTANLQGQGDKIARYFQILDNECDREINLINNFLDLQRLDTGVKPLVLEKIRVEQWLRRVVELFKARNRNIQQNLQVDIAADFPPFVCDPFSLERILVELLTNACKFSPSDAQIIVVARVVENNIQLQVINTGVEIPAGEIGRIFEKFYRIPSNDPWKQGGTGLGLALVQKLTKHLGGTITVESETNRTCFTFQLPLTGE